MNTLEASAATSIRRWNRLSRIVQRAILYLTVAAVTLVVFFPSYWLLVIAIQPTRFTLNYPPKLWPQSIRLSSLVELFETMPIGAWLTNSTWVAAGTTVVCLVFSILGAYALSSFRWHGRTVFSFGLLGTQMLPDALLVIPIFIIFRQLFLLDTLQGLVLVDAAFAIPVTIWILKGFFDSIPTEIEDAALIDGCSRMGVLWRVILPLSAPALVAVAVVGFFDGWNEYLFASSFITTQSRWVTSVGLASFIGELATPIELVMAGALSFTIPPIIFYLVMQKYIVSGLTSGAVKG